MQTAEFVERLRQRREEDTATCCSITAEPIFEEETRSIHHEDFDAEMDSQPSLLNIIESILKRRDRLDQLIRDSALQRELISKFLVISLIGFTFFGIAMVLVLATTGLWPQLASIESILRNGGQLIDFATIPTSLFSTEFFAAGGKLIVAYSLGLIAATGICLPSLYFYGLLSGIRMSMLDVTIHSLKAKATSAIALIGILPIYAAICMGIAIFDTPDSLVRGALWLGLILPFIAGLWGTRSLYVGFSGVCDTMPIERRARRECFLRRLVLSWGACYTAITPVMIYTLWEQLA